MKQKRHRDKKPSTKDYQKSNYDDQTDHNGDNGNKAMSMGLEDKKFKTKRMDQKEEKPSLCRMNDNALGTL